MPTAIGNFQRSLVLTETIATEGVYPSDDFYNAGMTIGMFHTYGFNFGMDGAPLAAGQVWNISQNTALFSILQSYYGGNGTSTFALPDLRGRMAISDGQGPGLTAVQLGQQAGVGSTLLT